MDSTNVIDPVIGAFNSINLLFLVYAVWLIATGSPIWKLRGRPTSTRPVVVENIWFRICGGIYMAGFLLAWLTGFGFVSWITDAAATIAYLIGLWQSLAPKVL